jgi:hypothetical protein
MAPRLWPELARGFASLFRRAQAGRGERNGERREATKLMRPKAAREEKSKSSSKGS